MQMRTCVCPSGCFVYGLHQPSFRVENLRENDRISALGAFDNGAPQVNKINFPESAVEELQAAPIFEIKNPFPFRGTTYINRVWADEKAKDPTSIKLPQPAVTSFTQTIEQWRQAGIISIDTNEQIFKTLPEAMLLALAATSTDPDDLVHLAALACEFIIDPATQLPTGLHFKTTGHNRTKPVINNHRLFEVVVNNPYLPDTYKQVMVLRPGIQGSSEIMGEYCKPKNNCHVFEYLRRNSYIPWGHYAANMADDSIRYHIRDLSHTDIKGLRHLYYQRTYVRLAEDLGIDRPPPRKMLTPEGLETLRRKIADRLGDKKNPPELFFNKTLWGWNYGFDYAPSNYRLHASHQQIHQQFALVPSKIPSFSGIHKKPNKAEVKAFGCGDLIAEAIKAYKTETGHSFFNDYLSAIRNNQRMDGNPDAPSSLIVYEDDQVLLFVPKAQTSQWELQLMPLPPVGHIIEADLNMRRSLDYAMWVAMKCLSTLGAKMITTIEYPKQMDTSTTDQRLIYSFLPKLPESPGGFSEAQMRWILGHYPEDFATACHLACPKMEGNKSI